ncbi:DUF3237 domain-containing protein [Streptosporangium sp. NPDC051022]|uniref:DUF3237 domain-containing protein n=1 Tax=Streptosporangium sp. NPDC051022 TaxID=3155752 RepID=UPI003435B7E9
MINELPGPTLTQVFRLHAVLGAPVDLGYGGRLIVPLIGGRFTGPELHGNLVVEGSTDRRDAFPDGTVRGHMRCTLRTDGGDLLDVHSHAITHGGPADAPLIRATTRLQAGAPHLAWVNQGVFISVSLYRGDGMTLETYLVS